MQANDVKLPLGELIEPSDLVKAIVKALFPEKTEGLTGLECITGKLVKISAPLPTENHALDLGAEPDSVWKRLLVPPVDNTELPTQLELPIQRREFTQDLLTKVVEDENGQNFWLTFHLTDQDRKQLKPLLSSLPPLTFPMTEYAISRFLDAYLALPQRPLWVPVIITWDTIRRRLEDHFAATEDHKKAVRQAIEEGKLSACDKRRAPTRFLSNDTLIPRSSAVEYLKRCGLSVSEGLHPADYANACEQSGDAILTATGEQVLNKKETGEKWTDEELEAVEAKLGAINPVTNKNYTQKKVAELLGFKSPGRISQLLKELKFRRKNPATEWETMLKQANRLNNKH